MQSHLIDNSDDYNLPMGGGGGREGVMRRGREEKEPDETNDDYRIVNGGTEPAVKDVAFIS